MAETTSNVTSLPSPPKDTQFHFPAEWEPHEACIILYPHNAATFRLPRAQEEIEHLAEAIVRKGGEKVYFYCVNEEEAKKLASKQVVKDNGTMIQVKICPSNDTWARDTAPMFCYVQTQASDDSNDLPWDEKQSQDLDANSNSNNKRKLVGLDWGFNAYGGPTSGCYWPCNSDQLVAKTMCSSLGIQAHSIPSFILEGGSVHTDGEGTLLTTEECLLNPNRNPNYSKQQIEQVLQTFLNASKVIWLQFGVNADEDTNGHIDNFACFVRPGHVVLAWTDDELNDPENYRRCRLAETVLQSTKDAKGRSITIHKLYLPPRMFYTGEETGGLTARETNETNERQEGQQMAASYINFYIANTAILVPQFGIEQTDSKALSTLQELFPDRTVIGISSRDILIGGGNIHCMTQQLPLP